MRHWAEKYIGLPWARGAQGPDAFDCWQFFRHVQRERFGRDVPDVEKAYDPASTLSCARAFDRAEERARWKEVSEPAEGDAVLIGRSIAPIHIGLWMDCGTVLHCLKGSGVVSSSLDSLRLMGLGCVRFFRFDGHA